MLLKIAQKDTSSKYRNFYTIKFGPTGDLNLALKDLTSLELKSTEKNALEKNEMPSIGVRSLILPRESIVKASVLSEMLKLVHEVLDDYYYEDRRRSLSPDVESLSHIVSSIMSLIGAVNTGKSFFLYSKENILYAFKILRMLIFNKDFVREFRMIETIVEASETLFTLLIEESKCHVYKNSSWEILQTEDLIEILSESISILSYYFFPMGRYSSRAEMAPTVARKVAESGIIKSAVTLLQSSNHLNSQLFKEIMKIVSEICRESQTLVPRLVEMGIIELIMKRVKDTFENTEDIGDVIQLISNVCLQDVGRELERKYQLLELFFETFTKDKYNNLNEKWLKAETKGGSSRRYGQLEKLERELIYITKYVPGYNNIVVAGVTMIADSLIKQAEQNLRDLDLLNGKNLSEEEQKQALELVEQNFSYYFHKLHNFLGIYSRYMREPRIRAQLFKEGGFMSLMKLLSVHQIFSPDYQLTQNRILEFCYGIIEKELENPDVHFLGTMEKYVSDELDILEKITGPLNNLKDFSGFIDEKFYQELSKKKTLRALFGTKGKAEHTFLFIRSLCLISIILQALVIYKLGTTNLAERLFELYGAYNRTTFKYNLSKATKLFQIDQEKSKADDKIANKIKKRINSMLNEKRDILSREHSFMARIKAFLDQCVYFDLTNPNKLNVTRYANVALQVLSELKDIKEMPTNIEEKIIFVTRLHIIFNTLFQVIHNSTPKQKLFQSSFPSFTFVLYEEGAFEILSEKLQLIVQLAADELNKDISEVKEENKENKENKENNRILQQELGDCLIRVNVIYEKLFFPNLEQIHQTSFKGKVLQGVELTEYTNCIWLSHVKLMLPLFDLISDVCTKINVFTCRQKENIEDSKEKDEENKKGKTEKALEKQNKESSMRNKMGLGQFVDLFFRTLARVFVGKQTATVASGKPIEVIKQDKGAEKVINDLCEMGFERKVAEIATQHVRKLLTNKI